MSGEALTAALNPDADLRWIVVDNSPRPVLASPVAPGVRLVPGAPRPRTRDLGSLHHAAGLEIGLDRADTRFVLLLDPDFYAIAPGWAGRVVAHMAGTGLALFGSVWHPRWHYQYRDFPTVHFMLVDTDRIPRDALALRPLIGADRWWHVINDDRVPIPSFLRDTLKAGRIRDTGWQVCRRFRDDPAVARETLVPHYVRPDTPRARWERRLRSVLPRSWLKYPGDDRGHTGDSLLRRLSPEAYARNWEEFFWRGAPFAVHMRRIGRAMAGDPTGDDLDLLDRLIGRMEPGDGR